MSIGVDKSHPGWMFDKRYAQRNVVIVDAHRQGATYTALAREHGISIARVRQIVLRAREKETTSLTTGVSQNE